MRLGNIKVLCPKLYGIYITVDIAIGSSSSDSEGLMKNQNAKKLKTTCLNLD